MWTVLWLWLGTLLGFVLGWLTRLSFDRSNAVEREFQRRRRDMGF